MWRKYRVASPKEIRESVDEIVCRFLDDLRKVEEAEEVEIVVEEVNTIPASSPSSFSGSDPQPEKKVVAGILYKTGVVETQTKISF